MTALILVWLASVAFGLDTKGLNVSKLSVVRPRELRPTRFTVGMDDEHIICLDAPCRHFLLVATTLLTPEEERIIWEDKS